MTATVPRGYDAGRRALAPRNVGATLVKDYLMLLLAVLVVALPLIYMILSSFKTPHDVARTDLVVFPSPWRVANYSDAMNSVPFGRMFLNSLIVTSLGSGLKVLLAILCAYALVFVQFPAKRYIFWAILATMMVPPQISMIPNYVLINDWGLDNTYWGILLPGLGSGFGTFLLRQAFMQLPLEVLEAAELDGAGHWQRLWRHVVPMCMPAIATTALVNVVYEWNDYLWPYLITDTPDMFTLPVGLAQLKNSESAISSYGTVLAGTVLVLVPVLVVFAALQRHIVAGLTQGAVKS